MSENLDNSGAAQSDLGANNSRKPIFRRRRSCPLSSPSAPEVDYKDPDLLSKFVCDIPPAL